MTRRGVLIPAGVVLGLLACVAAHATWGRPAAVTDARGVGRAPRMRPDYAGVVIPPNIAPLNFAVLEPGRRYYVRISAAAGRPIGVHSSSRGIVIPPGAWRRLLQANRGGRLKLEVYVQSKAARWSRFEPIFQTVAKEEIDSHLVYRLIRPLYNVYKDVGIYQRDLETYDESLVVHGRSFGNGCVNCHTFRNNRTGDMLLHIRGRGRVAMVLGTTGGLRTVDTRTRFNRSPASYSTWHPSGKFVTFSVNQLKEFNHAVGETRDVFDNASDLGCYVLAENAVKSTRHITQPDLLETFPGWSPDGRHLYFSRGPKTPIERWGQIRYDLMRVAYDPATGAWGPPETVLSARQTNGSITQARVSPDGRYVLCCLSASGSFPVYQPSSDLYLLDVQTGEHRRLPVNSDRCESWHSWSRNGRWFVFSSKRRDGVFAKPYFSYFDAAGHAHKPFVLPQRDPDFYESFLKTYNVPELVSQPVPFGPRDFARAILASQQRLQADGVSRATPKLHARPD
jgi:hypothetical protein